MLIGLEELAKNALAKHYAVGMFNVVNLEFAEAIVAAAEDLKAPVMLGLPERFFDSYSDLETIASICVRLASRATVPIAVHLDHGKSITSVMKAIRHGFTSVMFDGSNLPLQENIRQTAEIVKLAKSVGVSVEGELGYIGRSSNNEAIVSKSFTKAEEAAYFVEQTQVAALAIAIGTIHGVYKGTPQLDYERLQKIRSQVEVGLVLHGGSGLSDADFRKAVQLGINKVNIYTELSLGSIRHMNQNLGRALEWMEIIKSLRANLIELVKAKIVVFGAAGTAAQ